MCLCSFETISLRVDKERRVGEGSHKLDNRIIRKHRSWESYRYVYPYFNTAVFGGSLLLGINTL